MNVDSLDQRSGGDHWATGFPSDLCTGQPAAGGGCSRVLDQSQVQRVFELVVA